MDRNEVPAKIAYDDDPESTAFRSFTHGSNPFDPANGKLAAQVESSTGSVQSARNEIAQLKNALKTEVNAAYTPAEFFKVAAGTGKISVDVSSVSAGANGSNSIALAVASLGTKTVATLNTTFNAFLNKTVTTVAQQLSSTNTRLEDQKLSEEMAINSRDQYSGVSQDEEITDMMKFQRSFQASARHINVIDTLLEQVVNRLGVG